MRPRFCSRSEKILAYAECAPPEPNLDPASPAAALQAINGYKHVGPL